MYETFWRCLKMIGIWLYDYGSQKQSSAKYRILTNREVYRFAGTIRHTPVGVRVDKPKKRVTNFYFRGRIFPSGRAFGMVISTIFTKIFTTVYSKPGPKHHLKKCRPKFSIFRWPKKVDKQKKGHYFCNLRSFISRFPTHQPTSPNFILGICLACFVPYTPMAVSYSV